MLRVPARARRWFVNDTTIVVGIKLSKSKTRVLNPGSRSNYTQAAGRKTKLRGQRLMSVRQPEPESPPFLSLPLATHPRLYCRDARRSAFPFVPWDWRRIV